MGPISEDVGSLVRIWRLYELERSDNVRFQTPNGFCLRNTMIWMLSIVSHPCVHVLDMLQAQSGLLETTSVQGFKKDIVVYMLEFTIN